MHSAVLQTQPQEPARPLSGRPMPADPVLADEVLVDQVLADPLLAGRASLRLEALGLMTAGIVHDLGNIIQIMSGTVDVLEQHPAIRATKALQPAVERAVTSLDRARGLIRQVLNFAREDAGESETIELAACLPALERLLSWIGRNRMRTRIEVAPDTPRVFCNRAGLENAILNLALNAQDAMPGGGMLSIAAGPSSSDGGVSGVFLRVSDTGRGMSCDVMERAFDLFFTTKRARGNGLGLTMVRRFAQESSGSVAIESRLGRGTTVTLQFPLKSGLRS